MGTSYTRRVTSFALASPTRPRLHRMAAPGATIGGLAAATLALHFRDPHERGSWGFCPSAALGFYCPGCGGLRAVNDVTNGDLLSAASSNLLFMVVAPFLVLGLAVWTIDRWQGRRRYVEWLRYQGVGYAALTFVVLFSVVRNLPVGSWLAPG